ncbi:hypothetical protein PTKIN_Ptkin05aG0100900 [Pterospermum kingtungense]
MTYWYIPKFNTSADREAASRALDFLFGWFVDPVIFGEYPKSMRSLVGGRLPKFTEAESKKLQGSVDFLGVNYYTAQYAENAPPSNAINYGNDSRVNATTNNASLTVKEALEDSTRVRYLDGHLKSLLKAIQEGVNVKGHYYEWTSGYTLRFGLTYIDYKNILTRYLKYSAYWFKRFLLN